MNTKKTIAILGLLCLVAAALTACGGTPGPGTPAGPTDEAPQAALIDVQLESCVICHKDAGEDTHQAIYDKYVDKTTLGLTINSVKSVSDGAGGYNATMTFSITKDGLPFIDADELPSLEQKRFYTVTYDSATRMFDNDESFSDIVALGNGQYAATAEGIKYQPERSNGLGYGYIADTNLNAATGGRVRLYDDVASGSIAFGDVGTYESAAAVSGCEKCHGTPYGKHGYRQAVVAGIPDFASCKACHYDTREGGHLDWQVFADNPARYAEIHAGADFTAEEEAQYAYTANIMNDVHMTHAMEFPYPQSMATCATCHEGKLDMILTDGNFKLETCKSCHPVTGGKELDPADEDGEDTLYDTTEYALETIIPHDLGDENCTACHVAGGLAPAFNEIHTGFDTTIYTAAGLKYSDAITVTIDSASVADDKVTVQFSATEDPDLDGIDVADIVPTVMVGMYGWDTKDFIIGPHERLVDDNGDGEISRSSGDERALEYEVGAEHPRGSTVSAADGSWEVVLDMSTWGDLIDDGTVKRLEIAVMAELENADGVQVALDAPSRTFDLASNDFDDDFFSPIVKVADGCNTCHDALATTFHSPDRGGNVVVCRMCHITKSGGSHLELQSRSIDSYVHGIHAFQAFDIGDIDFENEVLATKYEIHVEHTIPTFTLQNCEACHNEGMFNVPDQSKSLPGILSGTDSVEGRNIGDYPSYVTGPAARACGGCHRAEFINEDDAGGLAAFFQHTEAGGYLVEETDGVLDKVIESIMALFE